jgi:outer membrane protein assembly factor BamA
VVARVAWVGRRRDTQNTFVDLGGDTGLRGYPSGAYYGFGANSVVGNLEYRTKPWELRSVHLGGVAFYDAGSVYRSLTRARLHHALGAGLRVLFPQLNRQVFRVDWGVPLDARGFAVTLSYGSSQSVALTPDEDLLGESEVVAQ